MENKTSIEWLWEQIDGIIPYQDIKTSQLFNGVLEQAKEMHKQEIVDAYETSHISMMTSEQYYQETFVSKGSDKVELPKQDVDKLGNEDVPKLGYDVEKLAKESWEGCDGCTEQDEIMYKNGYVKGYNAAIAELPKEISDEEIEKAVKNPMHDAYDFREGAKWYREQLKQNL